MQYPNTNSSTFPPKMMQFLPMNPFFQLFSMMSGFPSFPFPPPSDIVHMKLFQGMFEKFMQAQNQKNGTNSPDNLMFSSAVFENYLKSLKAGVPPSRTVPGLVKEEFIQKEEIKSNIPAPIPNPAPSNPTGNITNATPNLTANINLPQTNDANSAKEACDVSQPLDSLPKPTGQLNHEECIKEMLFYFVKHIGTLRRSIIEKDGERIHQNNPDLKEIFIGLMKKFLSSRKTKEEKIKYVLRKCFKFMKDKLLEENGFTFDSTDDYVEKLNSDKVDKMFFKHYFSERCGKQKKFLTKNEITFIKDFSMPFRKNSQNKTMNIEFLKWIFSNETFFSDYKLFLKNFNEVTNQDNIEKITKTAKKILELMETKNYKGFSQKYFKRMPWLDIWRIEAKEIALNLIDVYAKPEEKAEILDSDEISLETIEPRPKKIKTDIEVKTQAV